MKFRKTFLIDTLWENGDGAEVIEDKIVGNGRWSIHHYLVFKFENKFYLLNYSIGATEYQDECPLEYEPDEIECVEVKPVEKMIIFYEPV